MEKVENYKKLQRILSMKCDVRIYNFYNNNNIHKYTIQRLTKLENNILKLPMVSEDSFYIS